MDTITFINHPVYKQVLKDSCGGIIYDMSNIDKYDSKEILDLWDSLSSAEKNAADGIINGAINFLKGF